MAEKSPVPAAATALDPASTAASLDLVPKKSRPAKSYVRAAVSGAKREPLKTIALALKHPPKTPDFWPSLGSTLASLYLVARILAQTTIPASDYAVLTAAIAVILGVMARYRKAFVEAHPFHDQAKEYVRELEREQGLDPTDPLPAMPVSPRAALLSPKKS